MLRRSARIDAPGRLVDDQHRRAAVELAADDEFLQIAARKRGGLGIARALAHIHLLDDALGGRVDRACLAPCPPAPRNALRSVAWRDSSRFSDSFMRGAAPWPSRSSGTKAAPSSRRPVIDSRPASLPRMRIVPAVLLQHFAGHRLEELALAVAGDAGDADHLAGPDVELDVAAAGSRTASPACG